MSKLPFGSASKPTGSWAGRFDVEMTCIAAI
jgi:hypothetical protein